MNELTYNLLRFGLLLALWLFLLFVVFVLRGDLFSGREPRRARVDPANPAGPVVAAAPAAVPVAAAAPAAPAPPAPSRHQSLHTLVVTDGTLAGAVVALGTVPVLIGRSPDSTLVLSDDYASTRHARIFQDGGRWYLEDLGSTNGTTMNDQPVTSPVPIDPGVPIRIGTTVLELRG